MNKEEFELEKELIRVKTEYEEKKHANQTITEKPIVVLRNATATLPAHSRRSSALYRWQ